MANVIIFTGITAPGLYRSIGPYQVASRLREHGYTVQVVEYFPWLIRENLDVFWKILDKFVDSETLWIGFSTTFFKDKRKPKTSDFNDLQSNNSPFFIEEQIEIKKFVRSRSPKCKFVIGGARAWITSGEYLIDTYIEGYADNSAIEFTKWCQGRNPFFQYKVNKNGSISVVNDPKANGFDFINHKFSWHKDDHIFQGEAVPIELARGCIFSCSFCNFPLNGKKKLDYVKSPEVLLDQFIENYEKYGITRYSLTDDTYNDNVEKLELLYDKVFSKLPFDIKFSCYIRLDLLNAHPHTVQLLKDSGLENAYFGIESLNYESNKAIGKGIKLEKVIKVLNHIDDVFKGDIRTEGSFIFGLPHDSETTIRSWMKTLGNECDFGSIRLHPLQIRPARVDKSAWSSDIDKDPEKYGYTMIDNYRWINNAGLTYDRALELFEEYVPQFANKLPTFSVNAMLNIGCSVDEARYMINNQENLDKWWNKKEQKLNEYINRLVGK